MGSEMADDVVIRAEGLGKKYLIGHATERERYVALRDVLVRGDHNFWRKTSDMARGRAIVAGMTATWPNTFTLKGDRCTVYALDPKRPRQLAFYHAGRMLAGTLTVRGDEKEPPTVRLLPLGCVTARVLDGDGLPRPRQRLPLRPARAAGGQDRPDRPLRRP